MEITNELKQDLSTLESACGNFLEKYESVLTSALNKQEMSAEESLKIDLMLELITHLRSVCRFLYAERRRERGDPDPGSIRQLHSRRNSAPADDRYRSVCP